MHAHAQQPYDHRRHHEPFPWRQIGQLPTVRVWALESALHHAQSIKGGRENTEARNHRDCDADLVSAQQHEKLSDEIAQSRQAERGQTEEERSSAQAWRHSPDPTHALQITSVDAFL